MPHPTQKALPGAFANDSCRWLLPTASEVPTIGEVPSDGFEKLAAISYLANLWNWSWALLQVHLWDGRADHVNLEAALLSAMRRQLESDDRLKDTATSHD
jgi:hypothetical protein